MEEKTPENTPYNQTAFDYTQLTLLQKFSVSFFYQSTVDVMKLKNFTILLITVD